MNRSFSICILASVAVLGFGCGKRSEPGSAGAAASQPAQTRSAQPPSTEHHHEHTPPHGGTPVVLGDELYHLELVADTDAATLTAYIMDGHLENFIRCGEPSFTIEAKVAGQAQTLVFKPVSNLATDETVGDTSEFIAEAEWLRRTNTFDGKLLSLTIRGTKFENVEFNFPKGNDTEK
jgi:hypothetical protein